jgi:hypothetical protein
LLLSRRAVGRFLLASAGGGLLVAADRRGQALAAGPVTGHTPWRELGDTTAAAFQAEFERLGSPMAREAAAIRSEVDGFSRLFLAMSFHETKHATASDVIPDGHHNALAVKAANGSGNWARYPSYQAAARIWLRLMTAPDGPYADAKTIRDLISIYAPRFDNNKVTVYVRTIVGEINRYPLERERPAEDRKERERRPARESEQTPAAPAPTPAADRGPAVDYEPRDGEPRPRSAAEPDPGDGPPRPNAGNADEGEEALSLVDRLRLAMERVNPATDDAGESPEDGRGGEGAEEDEAEGEPRTARNDHTRTSRG